MGNEYWKVSPELDKKLHGVAAQFRKEPTASEDMLWRALRNRRLAGRKFKRQQPIGIFVVDFLCAEERLIVEVDGKIHESQHEADALRQELIESFGFRFVRVAAEEVEQNLPGVLAHIRSTFHP